MSEYGAANLAGSGNVFEQRDIHFAAKNGTKLRPLSGPFVRKAASYTTLEYNGHGQLTAPLRLRLIWSVGEDNGTGTEGPSFDQLQHLLLASLSEETLAVAHHDREDHEPIFIDQVQGH